MRNYEIVKLVTQRQKDAIMNTAKKATTKNELFSKAKEIALKVKEKYHLSTEEGKTILLSLYAMGLSVYAMERSVTVFDYITNYAKYKMVTYEKLNDFGAFGDLIEAIVHLVNCRETWRLKKTVVHVSAIGKTDVVIKGRKFEIGHNGKTWNEATAPDDDPMKGKFESVIYGVFNTDDKNVIMSYFEHGQYMRAIKEVCDMLYVFTDKYEFANFMNCLGRSDTLKYKSNIGRYITVYNPSKHNAFIQAIENNYPTLSDYMNSLGNNIFTTV